KGPLDYLGWRRAIDREVLDSIDGFIAVSKFVKKTHEELLPIESKPVEVVYNPITYPLKYSQSIETSEEIERNWIVYASGSNPVKGPSVLLEALKLLLDGGLSITLVMFNNRETWVEKYARKLGVNEHVIFKGRVLSGELYRSIFDARAVVMPSLWPEPFGRVAAEANRLGSVAIVTNRGGLPETIVHGETGFIAEANPEDLAKKIELSMELKKSREEVRNASLFKINPNSSLSSLLRFFETM
ncbi:glycosyltransferase family 4 protein, partial [Thermofilum sp.]|uniref:glycosyltransferase family 4 protein n=1 Tax=Thermofilum sp. TaxID=1961369 RepID=UPI0031624AAC